MGKLVLYYHPLSSYCQKLSIAMDMLGVEAERRLLSPGDPAQRDALLALWPTGKIPLLLDDGRAIPETSLIIEHLQRHHGCSTRLIPDDPEAAWQVRLWDRLFDLYVMTPMQALTADLLRPEGQRDSLGVAKARADLGMAYAMIERQLGDGGWVASEAFSLADCAAAPSLFYAVAYLPLAPAHPRLAAYLRRLLAHPPVARAIDEARPYFKYFPGRAGLAAEYMA